jgi:hypothetical protein
MRCKVGDLAIINFSGIPENVGRIVECMSLEFVEHAATESKMLWRCHCPTPLLGVDLSGVRKYNNIFYTPDVNLTPIKGITDEDVRKKEKGNHRMIYFLIYMAIGLLLTFTVYTKDNVRIVWYPGWVLFFMFLWPIVVIYFWQTVQKIYVFKNGERKNIWSRKKR